MKRYLKLTLAIATIVGICLAAHLHNGSSNFGPAFNSVFSKHPSSSKPGSLLNITLASDKSSGTETPIVITAQIIALTETGAIKFGWKLPDGVELISGQLSSSLASLQANGSTTQQITVLLHASSPAKILAFGVFSQGPALLRTTAILSLNGNATTSTTSANPTSNATLGVKNQGASAPEKNPEKTPDKLFY